MRRPTKFGISPEIIGKAPTRPASVDYDASQSEALDNIVSRLQIELAAAKAEVEALRGRKTFEDVKADLLKPVTDKVYNLVVGYCIGVALLLVMHGTNHNGFVLSDTVLSIVSGSTAVAVIGLIGAVIAGLFRK